MSCSRARRARPGASESHRCCPGSSRRAPLRGQRACAQYRRTPRISSTDTPKSFKETAARRRQWDTSTAHNEHDVSGQIQARQPASSDRIGVWRAGTYQVLTVCHAPCIGLSQKDGRRSACRTRLRPRGGRPACGVWLTSHGRSTRLRHAADCGSGEAEFRSGSLQIGVLLPGRCTSATAPHVRVLPAHTIIRFEIRGFSVELPTYALSRAGLDPQTPR